MPRGGWGEWTAASPPGPTPIVRTSPMDSSRPAAMTALGLAVTLAMRGDEVAGADWVGRCAGLLAGEPEGVEHGFLLALTSVLGPLNAISRADESAVL